MIGTQIGHYRLEEKLGEGAHGAVYRAVNTHDTALQVAIKLVRADLTGEPQFVEALRAECRRLDGLDHPAIVRFRDLIIENDQVAMVLELLKGQDLFSRIQDGPMRIMQVGRIMEQVLEGLAHAHQHGVLHRDIKPSNIFLCDDGRIKLVDFGVARAADNSRATRTGQLVGTMDYIAPERFTANGGGPASDVYAVGLVAWEMLTGRTACPEGELSQKLGWHLGVGAGDIRSLRPDCPDSLAEVIAQLCHREVAQRPADGRAALKQLDEWAETTQEVVPRQQVAAPGTVSLDRQKVADGVAKAQKPPSVVVNRQKAAPQRPQTVVVDRPKAPAHPPKQAAPQRSTPAWRSPGLAILLVMGFIGVAGVSVLMAIVSTVSTLGQQGSSTSLFQRLASGGLGPQPQGSSAMARLLDDATSETAGWVRSGADQILKDTQDDRERPEGFRYERGNAHQVFLRTWALQVSGEHCQAAAELRSVLDRTEWRGLAAMPPLQADCDEYAFRLAWMPQPDPEQVAFVQQRRAQGQCQPIDHDYNEGLQRWARIQINNAVKATSSTYDLDDDERFSDLMAAANMKGNVDRSNPTPYISPGTASSYMQGGSTYGLLLGWETDGTNSGVGLVSAIRRCNSDGDLARRDTMALLPELEQRGLTELESRDPFSQGTTIRESLILSVLASAAWDGALDERIDGIDETPAALAAELLERREEGDKVRRTIIKRLEEIRGIESHMRVSRQLYGR
jgi:serine/threonine protein kinase